LIEPAVEADLRRDLLGFGERIPAVWPVQVCADRDILANCQRPEWLTIWKVRTIPRAQMT
jgi:hypothetical protein